MLGDSVPRLTDGKEVHTAFISVGLLRRVFGPWEKLVVVTGGHPWVSLMYRKPLLASTSLKVEGQISDCP